jgi:hypothetical protein
MEVCIAVPKRRRVKTKARRPLFWTDFGYRGSESLWEMMKWHFDPVQPFGDDSRVLGLKWGCGHRFGPSCHSLTLCGTPHRVANAALFHFPEKDPPASKRRHTTFATPSRNGSPLRRAQEGVHLRGSGLRTSRVWHRILHVVFGGESRLPPGWLLSFGPQAGGSLLIRGPSQPSWCGLDAGRLYPRQIAERDTRPEWPRTMPPGGLWCGMCGGHPKPKDPTRKKNPGKRRRKCGAPAHIPRMDTKPPVGEKRSRTVGKGHPFVGISAARGMLKLGHG